MEPVGSVHAEPPTEEPIAQTVTRRASVPAFDETRDETLPASLGAFGGGKGGVGKSVVSCSVAYWLGRIGRRVVLVDADLGGANLHTLLGIRVPKRTLEDFLLHQVDDIADVLLPTPFENVLLLAGGCDVTALANPNYAQKSRLLRAFRRLVADEIIVDLGSGTSLNVLDFFLACRTRCVVLSPQPTSVQNAYGFVKSALYRQIARIVARTPDALRQLNRPSGPGLPTRTVPQLVEEIAAAAPQHRADLERALADFRVDVIVNMVQGAREEQTAQVVQGVCKRYLGIDASPAGAIPFDPAVERWASTMDPSRFLRSGLDGARRATYDIAMRLAEAGVVAKAA